MLACHFMPSCLIRGVVRGVVPPLWGCLVIGELSGQESPAEHALHWCCHRLQGAGSLLLLQSWPSTLGLWWSSAGMTTAHVLELSKPTRDMHGLKKYSQVLNTHPSGPFITSVCSRSPTTRLWRHEERWSLPNVLGKGQILSCGVPCGPCAQGRPSPEALIREHQLARHQSILAEWRISI